MALLKKNQDLAASEELERKKDERQEKLTKIKSSLTPDQMRVYREHFELFDLNGDGVISARELRKVSRQMGYRLDDSQIEVGVRSLLLQLLMQLTADNIYYTTVTAEVTAAEVTRSRPASAMTLITVKADMCAALRQRIAHLQSSFVVHVIGNPTFTSVEKGSQMTS